MNPHLLDRTALFVAAIGAALTACTFLLGGTAAGIGAAVGAGLALLNWMGLRWAGGRLLRPGAAGPRGRLSASLLLGAKTALLMVVIWALVVRAHVHAVGLLVGLSALMLGVLLAASRAGIAPTTGASEDG